MGLYSISSLFATMIAKVAKIAKSLMFSTVVTRQQ